MDQLAAPPSGHVGAERVEVPAGAAMEADDLAAVSWERERHAFLPPVRPEDTVVTHERQLSHHGGAVELAHVASHAGEVLVAGQTDLRRHYPTTMHINRGKLHIYVRFIYMIN